MWFKLYHQVDARIINLPAILMSRIFRKKVILNFVGGSAIDTAKNWNFIKMFFIWLML